MNRSLFRHPALLIVFAYLLAAIIGAVATGNREFLIYIGVMAVLIPSLYAVYRKYPLTNALVWAFSLWGALHMAGGLLPIPTSWNRDGTHAVLYSWWLIPGRLKYDHIVHAYGFGITAWMCWHVLKFSLRCPDGSPVRPTVGMLVLCVAAAMGFGAFNEVVEFVATLLIPNTNVGDYNNTGWDLVANLVGAILAVSIIRWRESRSVM